MPSCAEVLPPELMACLNTRAALERLGGNLNLYLRMLKMFHANEADSVQQIRRVLQANDLVQAQRLAHTLKSVAAALGADELSIAAKQLESAIEDNEKVLFDDVLDDIEQQFDSVMAAIANV